MGSVSLQEKETRGFLPATWGHSKKQVLTNTGLLSTLSWTFQPPETVRSQCLSVCVRGVSGESSLNGLTVSFTEVQTKAGFEANRCRGGCLPHLPGSECVRFWVLTIFVDSEWHIRGDDLIAADLAELGSSLRPPPPPSRCCRTASPPLWLCRISLNTGAYSLTSFT